MTEREYRQVWDYERRLTRTIRRRRLSRLLWRLATIGYFAAGTAAIAWVVWGWL